MNNRLEILRSAVAYRSDEVFNHQVNIDNYTCAIAIIEKEYSSEGYMIDFAGKLRDLLISSIQEQTKERVMLAAMEMQISELEAIDIV